ncbi:hypothetical protein TRVL_04779 [Trypanosoma vivax]|uniref:Uncharacterized protein n=1 Tax=Trypanosoma vivax (strain Y486) TaxID=1055687 RepID=G0U2K9_TRYVY|nr:hypothetical protein TRVL_04779 [Trypanosoma vivax]CCC50512.1 hypothetical protein, unlikely [Trypanosoma vivax Y486]
MNTFLLSEIFLLQRKQCTEPGHITHYTGCVLKQPRATKQQKPPLVNKVFVLLCNTHCCGSVPPQTALPKRTRCTRWYANQQTRKQQQQQYKAKKASTARTVIFPALLHHETPLLTPKTHPLPLSARESVCTQTLFLLRVIRSTPLSPPTPPLHNTPLFF